MAIGSKQKNAKTIIHAALKIPNADILNFFFAFLFLILNLPYIYADSLSIFFTILLTPNRMTSPTIDCIKLIAVPVL